MGAHANVHHFLDTDSKIKDKIVHSLRYLFIKDRLPRTNINLSRTFCLISLFELVTWKNHVGEHTRRWYLSHFRATKAQASLRKCAHSPESSLLACTKSECRGRPRPKLRPLASLDVSAWVFKGSLCACAIRAKVSCVG